MHRIKKQKQEFKKLIQHLKRVNDIPIGIQLSHSGRKGSSEIPWIKANTPLKKKKPGKHFRLRIYLKMLDGQNQKI